QCSVPSVSADKAAARLRRRNEALALRETMSPPGPAPDRLRVATWNLNSLRARLPAVERFLERAQPDVLLLQETKTASLSDAASSLFDSHGYVSTHVGAGAYNGVAVMSRFPIRDAQSSGEFDNEHLDREPRLATCVVETPDPVRVASVYVPHGREIDHWHFEYKLAFLDALAAQVRGWVAEGHVMLGGDVNVAPTDSDIFHPDAFVGLTHVTPSERAGLQAVLEEGLVDVDAAVWGPRARRFTWWNHGFSYPRNLGMRIDLLAVDTALAQRIATTWIDHVERGAERPSDHAALVADFFTT
ncbi:MAG: exodeoxyribonuclease, partial [Actinomycetota bacterium]